MVRFTQLFWAISVATGAVGDRFGNKLQLRTYSSHIIEAETTVQLRNLPENKEGYAIIWTGLQDAANEVIVQGMASNVGFECGGTSEQWCVVATGNLGISFPEGQRQKYAQGFALTPGPSYKIRCKTASTCEGLKVHKLDDQSAKPLASLIILIMSVYEEDKASQSCGR